MINLPFDMNEQELKAVIKQGMLLLVDRTDKVYAEMMNDMEDKQVVEMAKKLVDTYRILLRKVIEENSK